MKASRQLAQIALNTILALYEAREKVSSAVVLGA
jgi:hypothetical protein